MVSGEQRELPSFDLQPGTGDRYQGVATHLFSPVTSRTLELHRPVYLFTNKDVVHGGRAVLAGSCCSAMLQLFSNRRAQKSEVNSLAHILCTMLTSFG